MELSESDSRIWFFRLALCFDTVIFDVELSESLPDSDNTDAFRFPLGTTGDILVSLLSLILI